MKIRWRQHEIIFASLSLLTSLMGFWWKTLHLTLAEIRTIYEPPFLANSFPFGLYRNLLLPQSGIFVLVYILYMWVNLFIIPRLIQQRAPGDGKLMISGEHEKSKAPKRYYAALKKCAWLIMQILVVVILLGTGVNTAAYYLNECYFHYPGFTFFPPFGNHPQAQLDLFGGYKIAAALLAGYGCYLAIRELAIAYLERAAGNRTLRILMVNKVTALLVIYCSVPWLVASFQSQSDQLFYVSYISLASPLLLIYLSNTYWLFPLKGDRPFLDRGILLRLLVSTLSLTLPFALFLSSSDHFTWATIISLWSGALFILTPLSWLQFQQQKDPILQLRAAEKSLVKSRTSLEYLRSQINPHFLFNILNTLYGTALNEKAERTASGIQQLGDMMRFMLHENMKDTIEMDREIEYLRNYISLQKLRTPDSGDVEIKEHISGEPCPHRIAPMLFIPLVENAFKHGISLSEKSWIRIELSCTPEQIRFLVSNSVHRPGVHTDQGDASGIGLKNVRERLKLLYPGRYIFSANPDERQFRVELIIYQANRS